MTDPTEHLLIRAERLMGEVASLLSDIRLILAASNGSHSADYLENQRLVMDTELRAAVVGAVKAGRMVSSDIAALLSSHGARVVTDIKDPGARCEVLRALS